MRSAQSSTIDDPALQKELQESDEDLRKEAARVRREREHSGQEGLVGGLQAVIINCEPHLQEAAVEELIRYSGLQIHEAFMDDRQKTYVLKVPGNERFSSANFLIRSRLKGANPFQQANAAPKTHDMPNTRLETFVFETSDIKRYVSIQREANTKFQSGIQDLGNYYFIQTMPSKFTGNSLGFIEWKGEKGIYQSPESRSVDWKIGAGFLSRHHLGNILWLDHAATRVRAQDRGPAIQEFMRLTNYNFDFAIYVKSQNSITNVLRLSPSDFAMVFTSGISPYVSQETSGPTEKFISNFGPRVHHIAFQTEEIEETVAALGRDGMKFLLNLVGSPEEGLKQIFSEPSENTLLVTEYIHRYGNFDGFFTRSNVTSLTAATDRQ
ncbi:MAG: hypothetical protein ACP5OU_04015 [Methanothrix sp.]